jgi:acetolactate synthase-1/3 small subunit
MKLTFVAHVTDRPGVLNRVASLIRRRGYNIDALSVGHSEVPGVSRLTIVVQAEAGAAGRIEANLYKLVDVRHVAHLTQVASVSRDLALIKVRAVSESRSEIVQLVDVFRGRVVYVAADSLVIEVTGAEGKIDGFVDMLRPFGVLEVARTGRVTMARGNARPVPTSAGAAPPAIDDSVACSV